MPAENLCCLLRVFLIPGFSSFLKLPNLSQCKNKYPAVSVENKNSCTFLQNLTVPIYLRY